MKKWSKLMLLVGVLGLSACGFHLRGMGGTDRPMPFTTIHVVGDGTLVGPLNTVLKRNQNIQVVGAGQAEASLEVLNEDAKREVMTINRGGSVNEYLYRFTARAQLHKNGAPYGQPLNVSVRRTMDYTDRDVLGKEDEEGQLWQEMRMDAAEQLVRRLAYIKPDATETADEQPAGLIRK
ncbi:MAG: hypothetical protein KBC57_04985 [Neisseriaceae bacterium]|nr:hypothetical protein [Neisseriaceae bacterium]MBP6861697.1 hypothetical protein [Neisseriaceae bacterium]